MTEAQIESRVAQKTDALDRAYLTTAMAEADYHRKLAEIDAWANRQLVKYFGTGRVG